MHDSSQAMQAPLWGADRIALFISPVLLIVLIVVFSGWTGDQLQSALSEVTWALLTSLPWVIGWLVAAAGFGWPLRIWLFPAARDGLLVQSATGFAALLWLDAALGAAGWLQFGSNLGAWTLLIIGILLAGFQCVNWLRTKPQIAPIPWHAWLCLPCVAVLMVAACSAPGWLWASEFGGYDALSYHLQLPKEWMALGSGQPLQHNVYSFLPGYMEGAYYHLSILIGDAVKASYACQLLHAGFTLFTAVCAARFAWRVAGTWGGSITLVVFLTTPWVIVVGSLAYNEMAALAMLSAILLVASDQQIPSWRRGALIGLLCGAACGAKLTAAGFVVAPSLFLLLWTMDRRECIGAVFAATITGLVMLAPYLVRNCVASGNPLFPFAGGLLGYAHWAPEQADTWTKAHGATGSVADRLTALWNQFLRYGLGENPFTGEPWKPQWSILPVLGFAAACIAIILKSTRKWAVSIVVVVVVQILFWMTMTHLKSRFLLPTAVPLAALVGIAAGHLLRDRTIFARTIVAILLVALNVPMLFVFRSEHKGAPAAAIGSAPFLSGDKLSAAARHELGPTALPAIAINHLLPENSRVLLIGDATPFYFHADRIAYQTTWDRGLLSSLMREFPNDEARWAAELRARGFTHVLVDASMLRRWERSGWNDPLITADRVMKFTSRSGRVLYSYPGNIALYELAAD